MVKIKRQLMLSICIIITMVVGSTYLTITSNIPKPPKTVNQYNDLISTNGKHFKIDNVIISGYTNHTPITITSNGDFETLGFPGNGTETNPYLIANYRFTGMASETFIRVQNTTSHFRIQHNFFDSGFTAVKLVNVVNGTIYNNTMIDNQLSVFLDNSYNNSINLNRFNDSGRSGLTLSDSLNNDITNNTFENSGIFFAGGERQVTENNLNNNTVNGEPLIIFQNEHDAIFEGDAGQIILVNSSRIEIRNISINHTVVAIHLINSHNNSIHHNNLSENRNRGIYLYQSNNNSVFNNTISFNQQNGISIIYSTENSISNNTFESNEINGVFSDQSSYNVFESNTISDNFYGIRIKSSSNSIVSDNEIVDHYDGILIETSSNLSIINNSVDSNIESATRLVNSENNTLSFNRIQNSYEGIILEESLYNSISSNDIKTSAENGVWLVESMNNSIINNSISENRKQGIKISASSSNYISNNSIFENIRYGVYIRLAGGISELNHIIFNNFIANNEETRWQVYDQTSSNLFEYNYYDDWTSPDEDNNGIVDDGYPVHGPGENLDRTPLVYPVGEERDPSNGTNGRTEFDYNTGSNETSNFGILTMSSMMIIIMVLYRMKKQKP